MNGKKVVFRADASYTLGSGHIMRCLTLADVLAALKYEIYFICRNLPGNMMPYIKQRGYKVYPLEPPPKEDMLNITEEAGRIEHILKNEIGAARWLVADHYGIDAEWENAVKKCAESIMVIDDLADRKHECDILLDQNYYINGSNRYRNLIPDGTLTLLGPKYALLRPEFLNARRRVRIRDGRLRRVLVFFGGSDPLDATGMAIQVLQPLAEEADFNVDVVVGFNNPQKDEVRECCRKYGQRMRYHCQISNMSQLMLQADLAIGAGGTTVLERCFLGLPAIILIVAPNQMETTAAAASAGAAVNIGCVNWMSAKFLRESLQKIVRQPGLLRQMSAAALRLMRDTPVSIEKVRDLYRHAFKNVEKGG